MKQAARITLRSRFGWGEEHEETIEQHTGSLSVSERGLLLRYRTDEPCDVLISATDERITIRREGTVRNSMVLCKGCTHPMAYTTAMGTLRIEVRTLDFAIRRPERKAPQTAGEITARYELLNDGEAVSSHRLHIIFETL